MDKLKNVLFVLNSLAKERFSGNLLEKFPIIKEYPRFQTRLFYFPEEDAFPLPELQPLFKRENIEISTTQNRSALIRLPIGYSTCLEFTEKHSFFDYYMNIVVNEMLLLFSTNIPGLHNLQMGFADGNFFREVENSAVFETRFYTLKD